ncbi:MAG: tetratricopeptide repeat protein [Lentilitoribacter sp.]
MNVDQLSKDPNERDTTILQALAAGQYAFGQYQTAMDLLELALSLDPENTKTYVMMARIQYSVGDLDEALDYINIASSTAINGLEERDQIFERRIKLLGELAGQQRLLG